MLSERVQMSLDKFKKQQDLHLEFSEDDEELLNIIFEFLKTAKENADLKEIREQLEEGAFSKLCNFVKEDNKGYFALEYFRKESEVVKLEFEYLYKNTIVVNRYKTIKKKYSSLKTHLTNILNVLQAITFYCIEYNHSGEEFVNVLLQNYDIPRSVCEGIEEIFNENKLSLKLDYLINNLD